MAKLGVFWIAGVLGVAAATFATPTHADAPAPDAARVELGRRLFFDPAIGRQGRVACAACHDPERGFSDPRPLSQDETRVLTRHSQPLVDLAGKGFHWDGEFDTVRDVIDARVLPAPLAAKAAAERGLRRIEAVVKAGASPPDAAAIHALLGQLGQGGPYGTGGEPMPAVLRESIAERFAHAGRYDAGFTAAFGDADVTEQRIGDALEAYVGSLRSATSPFDRHLAGDTAAIGESAQRGASLFRGKAGCVQCHTMDGDRPAFTDGAFHNTGVEARRPGIDIAPPPGGMDAAQAAKFEELRRAFAERRANADIGRLAATFTATDRGSYKTPGLRDVARRAPYFHDASAANLTDVVRYYVAGGTANPHLDERVRPLDLTDADVADLVAFLETLTGDVRAGLGPVGGLRAPEITVRVENVDGSPVAGMKVTVQPFGDRLAGTSAMPRVLTATTDADGRAVVAMPLTTHVVVATDSGASTEPLPDWTTATTIVVVPRDRVVARVRFRDGDDVRPGSFKTFVADMFVPGSAVRFTKVRDLGPSESLYVCAGGRKLGGAADCVVCLPNAIRGAAYRLDFAPATTNVIDLRAKPDASDEATLAALRADIAKIAAFVPRQGQQRK